MTNDEAARPNDDAARHDAQAAPPAQPARPTTSTPDERPRPRYGEYAPEGWTWTPPANDPYSGTSNVEPDAAAEAATSRNTAANPWGGTPAGAQGRADGAVPARPADRAWTIALLVLGVIGVIYNCLVIVSFPSNVLESAKLTAEMLGTPAPTEFTPGPAVPAAIAIGVIAQIALWVGALLWSRARMRAGATSWWIPILAGVVAFVVMMIVSMVVLASDPALLELLQSAGASGS